MEAPFEAAHEIGIDGAGGRSDGSRLQERRWVRASISDGWQAAGRRSGDDADLALHVPSLQMLY